MGYSHDYIFGKPQKPTLALRKIVKILSENLNFNAKNQQLTFRENPSFQQRQSYLKQGENVGRKLTK